MIIIGNIRYREADVARLGLVVKAETPKAAKAAETAEATKAPVEPVEVVEVVEQIVSVGPVVTAVEEGAKDVADKPASSGKRGGSRNADGDKRS